MNHVDTQSVDSGSRTCCNEINCTVTITNEHQLQMHPVRTHLYSADWLSAPVAGWLHQCQSLTLTDSSCCHSRPQRLLRRYSAADANKTVLKVARTRHRPKKQREILGTVTLFFYTQTWTSFLRCTNMFSSVGFWKRKGVNWTYV